MSEPPSDRHRRGFIANDAVLPVLQVDFNSPERKRMWAERGWWVMEVGQRVILDDGGEVACYGRVVEVAPLDFKGDRAEGYVVCEALDEGWWYPASPAPDQDGAS